MNNSIASSGASKNWLGIGMIILGILAILIPQLFGFSILFLTGLLLTVAAVGRLFWVYQHASNQPNPAVIIVAVLSLLLGVMMMVNPVFISGFITLLMVLYFIVDGAWECMTGWRLRNQQSGKWLLIGGVISILLGLLLWLQFPLSGAWAIGILFGIKLIIVGVIILMAKPVKISNI